jgi:hypothetical protein
MSKKLAKIEPSDATLKPPDANQEFDVNLLMPLFYHDWHLDVQFLAIFYSVFGLFENVQTKLAIRKNSTVLSFSAKNSY